MTPGEPNNFRYLLPPVYISFAVIFFAWLLPNLVSYKDYAFTAMTITGIAGMISMVIGWRKYHLLTNQVGHSPKPADVVLEKCRSNGLPYAVYLRSFDSELGQRHFDLPGLLWGWDGSLREVEILVARHLQGRLPVLALANPSDPFTLAGAHRFRRLPMPWLMFLEELLPGAALIVINITGNTPGVITEMNLVRDLGVIDKTLVVGGTRRSYPDVRWVSSGDAKDLHNTLDDILDCLRARGEKIPQWEISYSRPKLNGAHRFAQVSVFLLMICLAYFAWGEPKLANAEYRSKEQYLRELIERMRR